MVEKEVYILRMRRKRGESTAPDLDGYVFTDYVHAVNWMSQPFIVGSGYFVQKWRARRVKCPCGHGHYWKRLKLLNKAVISTTRPKGKR